MTIDDVDEITRRWILNESDRLAVSEGCYFSEKDAEKPVTFMGRFCHSSKGRWAGQKLVLIPWELDFTRRLFGWRRADGRRRFNSAYVEIAKKNGKTTYLSALSLYMLVADDEPGPEIYINACSRDQASLIFDESARMVRKSPSLAKRCEVVDSRKVIVSGDGKIVANSSDADKRDGPNASCVWFDELHRQPDRSLWDVFEFAGLARDQFLRISITTAGEDEYGIWFDQREYSEKVEQGVIRDATHLGVVYRAKEEDDIDSRETWLKANPSLGYTLTYEDFEKDLKKAKENAASLANFKRLRLNVVARGEGKFVELAEWDACSGQPTFAHEGDCFAGLDLSSRDDLTALVWIKGSLARGIDVHCQFWLPREGIAELERRHGQPYRTWADQGLIVLTPGNTIDYDFVEAAIVELAGRIGLTKLMADQFNGKKLCENLLNKHGLPVEYLRQGYLSLSDPTKTLLELIKAGKVRHGGNPILRWHMANAVAEQDAAGNLKLSKRKSRRKIDGAAALVDAVAGLISGPVEEPSVYERRGFIFLEL